MQKITPCQNTLIQKNINLLSIPNINSPAEAFEKIDSYYYTEIVHTTPIERYTAKFEKHIVKKEDLTIEQKNVLDQFSKTLQFIDSQLKPFETQGIHYTLGIAGGCVRDFLMNKSDYIKDIDVVVCFHDTNNIDKIIKLQHPEKFVPEINPHQFKEITGKEPQQSIYDFDVAGDTSPKKNENSKKIILTQACSDLMAQKAHVKNTYFSHMNIVADYFNDQIYGDIKIDIPGVNYPVDLVIAKQDTQDFLHTFDFAICKAACVYKKTNPLSNLGKNDFFQNEFDDKKEGWENVYDNFLIMHTFLKDLNDKTLTLNAKHFSPEHIDYFMRKHYKNLNAKHPDYRLNVIKVEEEDIKNHIEKAGMAIYLDQNLSVPKIASAIKRKI